MATRRRVNLNAANRSASNMYVYGNTVRQVEVMPERRHYEEEKPRRKKKASSQIKKNRKRALRMNPAYLAFLTLATVVTLMVCVWYLQLRSEVSARSANITALQQELVDIKEENTSRYNSVVDSVNLETVREKAIKDLGMVYAKAGQIVTYQNPEHDYVKQYEEIPENGSLSENK